MTTAEILLSIHIANRLTAESTVIMNINEAVASKTDDASVIHQMQNAAMAAEAMMNHQQVDASPQQLDAAYEEFRKPPPPAVETPGNQNAIAQMGVQIEEFARQYRSCVIATVGDIHPEQMPKHLRDVLWLAIAAHDAVRQAAAAARRSTHSNLLIPTGR